MMDHDFEVLTAAEVSLRDAQDGMAAWERYAHRVEAERDQLRAGVQALAQQWDQWGAKCLPAGDFAYDLRKLLDSTQAKD